MTTPNKAPIWQEVNITNDPEYPGKVFLFEWLGFCGTVLAIGSILTDDDECQVSYSGYVDGGSGICHDVNVIWQPMGRQQEAAIAALDVISVEMMSEDWRSNDNT